MPATLTHDMLADLHIGNASLSLLPYSASGLDITSGVSFAAADQIFTLEGTFNLTSDDSSGTEIRIDQHKEVIDFDIDKGGNWRMTGNIPTQAEAVLSYFFTDGATVAAGTASTPTGVTGQDGNAYYTGKGFLATPEVIEVSVLAESETKNTAILFPHVKMVVSPIKKDDNTNPAYLSFVGYILPNPYKKSDNLVGDFVVLKAAAKPTV